MTPQYLHAERLLAARFLLAQWARRASCVTSSDGVLEPHAVAPAGLPTWPLKGPDVEELLVASVVAGNRYAGWAEAMKQARGQRRAA